jgi:hypothetical protein
MACGGISDNTLDGGGDSGPGPGKNCPSSQPKVGDGCNNESLQCEYGSDDRYVCNTILTCNGGTWDSSFSDPSCPTKNGSSCPATMGQIIQGSACGSVPTTCDYSTSQQTSFCACTFSGGPPIFDGGGPSYTWQCSYGSMTGCPAVRPRLGESCPQPNLNCNYDICGAPTGLSVQCDATTNTWKQGFGDVCAGANGG